MIELTFRFQDNQCFINHVPSVSYNPDKSEVCKMVILHIPEKYGLHVYNARMQSQNAPNKKIK